MCCVLSTLCNRHDERTRIPTCVNYKANERSTSFGDPHIVTLDGQQYTFNGLGDYWLLTTNSTNDVYNLNIQARTCVAKSATGDATAATVFCGFAFQEVGQPKFELYHNVTTHSPSYYVDGSQLSLASSTQSRTAVIYSTSASTIKFIFPSGTVLEIQIGKTMLQSVVITPVTLAGKTKGLLGNVNGVYGDDFISRYTGRAIPSTSSEKNIYNNFGQTWSVSNQENMFNIGHHNLGVGYEPKFWTNVTDMLGYNDTLISQVKAVCGDPSNIDNRECFFDFAVTGNEEMATSGKSFIETSKLIIQATGRVPPKVVGPAQINVTRFIAMNFTINVISNSTNLTYFILTNFTDSFKLLDANTGLVGFNPKYTNETITVGVTDEYLNTGQLQVKILVCDCANGGQCTYDSPELLGNRGKLYTQITQCSCLPGFSGYRCENYIDACLLDPCYFNVTCTTHDNRSSTCEPCPRGYSGNGRKCHDIDDCAGAINPCEQICSNVVGSYECSCRNGFFKDGIHNCTDIDECKANATICAMHRNTRCNNKEGSYECICNKGFRWNALAAECQDINECDQKTDLCMQKCINTEGSYNCSCIDGTQLNADNRTCKDVNECKGRNDCSTHADCYNLFASYRCKCKSGYDNDTLKNGSICQDVNECSAAVRDAIGLTTQCEVKCANVIGSYQCSCNSDQQLTDDKHTCIQRLNECIIENKNPCDVNAKCEFNMTRNTYDCTCNQGYNGTGTKAQKCNDVNECILNSTLCSSYKYSVCNNTSGGYKCDCQPGFHQTDNAVKSAVCEDDDECSMGKSNCPSDSVCRNTIGAFECRCFSGLQLSNNTCEDIDECKSSNGGCSQLCTNNRRSHACSCRTGYTTNLANSAQCDDQDECRSDNNCHAHATCTNTIGSYNCTCTKGHTGNGFTCADDDECARGASVHKCKHICVNNDGSFKCSCRSGYSLMLDLKTCKNDNECLLGSSNCKSNTLCVDTEGSYWCKEQCPGLCTQKCKGTSGDQRTHYTCSCNSGYELTGKFNCTNINECEGNSTCHASAKCIDTPGSYKCQCADGYKGGGKSPCADIDECSVNRGGCHANAKCANTIGSYGCSCNTGYSGNGTFCRDIIECDGDNGCHDNATCTNTIGSYNCACKSGFNGNGTSCIDVNECLRDAVNGCHINATCLNYPGYFECKCKYGFDGNGTHCVDQNECKGDNNKGGCHADAQCANAQGSYQCVCNSGYTGDGRSNCTNVNECLSDNGKCHISASCRDTIGSRACKCNNGYQGNGVTCSDVDECLRNNACQENSTCTNTVGSFNCTCKLGFTGNGVTCDDIDECVESNGKCDANATCHNTPGSRTCTCNSGFDGNGTTCVDRNECKGDNHGCHADAVCTNIAGGHNCVCNSGYSGNGTTCTNVNECAKDNGGCAKGIASCTDRRGSRKCKCHDGYTGNGVTCTDINECNTDNGGCHAFANCTNTPGNRTCTCMTGYQRNGVECIHILSTKSPNLVTKAPTGIRVMNGFLRMYDISVNGALLNPVELQEDLKNMSSAISISLTNTFKPVLLHYYLIIDPNVQDVIINSFRASGSRITKRSVYQSGSPAIDVNYTVKFKDSQVNAPAVLLVALNNAVNLTDNKLRSTVFLGHLVPQSATLNDVNPCTTNVLSAKHNCDKYATCVRKKLSYTCNCLDNYAGDGYKCKYIGVDRSFLVAIIATCIGLFLLILLLIVFLVVRKRKRDRSEEDDTSSYNSDIIGALPPGSGMRARSMYNTAPPAPAGPTAPPVQILQYKSLPIEER